MKNLQAKKVLIFQLVALLSKVRESFPSLDVMRDLHCDDKKYARKYPLTLTDNLMMEIHETFQKLEQLD